MFKLQHMQMQQNLVVEKYSQWLGEKADSSIAQYSIELFEILKKCPVCECKINIWSPQQFRTSKMTSC